jgi:type IV pilus assembly protein PilX
MEQVISRSAGVAAGQRGIALIMVLIMLTAMTIAGVALVRVIDSANVISGNFAFRQATLSIADLGTEAAVTELNAIRAASGLDKPYPPNCTTQCRYFPAMSLTETMLRPSGLPKKGSVDGAASQDIDWSGNDVNEPPDPQRPPENPSLRGYEIRYVIDRQCRRAPLVDAIADCLSATPQSGASKKSGATVFTPASSIFYRVSIQVTGPRKTQSHVQVVLGF